MATGGWVGALWFVNVQNCYEIFGVVLKKMENVLTALLLEYIYVDNTYMHIYIIYIYSEHYSCLLHHETSTYAFDLMHSYMYFVKMIRQ